MEIRQGKIWLIALSIKSGARRRPLHNLELSGDTECCLVDFDSQEVKGSGIAAGKI